MNLGMILTFCSLTHYCVDRAYGTYLNQTQYPIPKTKSNDPPDILSCADIYVIRKTLEGDRFESLAFILYSTVHYHLRNDIVNHRDTTLECQLLEQTIPSPKYFIYTFPFLHVAL